MDKALSRICCPCRGGAKFKQEVVETYLRYIGSDGKVSEYETDFTHDIDPGVMCCAKCGADRTNLFDETEIE